MWGGGRKGGGKEGRRGEESHLIGPEGVGEVRRRIRGRTYKRQMQRKIAKGERGERDGRGEGEEGLFVARSRQLGARE